MKEKEALLRFGKILISEVRDEAIDKYKSTISGKLKSKSAMCIYSQINSFSAGQLEILENIVKSSIDDVIHNFLWMLEQHDGNIDLLVGVDDENEKLNLVDISDGLCGELYSKDGWIDVYSAYKN